MVASMFAFLSTLVVTALLPTATRAPETALQQIPAPAAVPPS